MALKMTIEVEMPQGEVESPEPAIDGEALLRVLYPEWCADVGAAIELAREPAVMTEEQRAEEARARRIAELQTELALLTAQEAVA